VRHCPSEAEMGDRRRTKVPRNPPQTPERSTAAVISWGPCLTARPEDGPKTAKRASRGGRETRFAPRREKDSLLPAHCRTSHPDFRFHSRVTYRSGSGPT
jgi:hypothetical protein